jgi:hypothetical protein
VPIHQRMHRGIARRRHPESLQGRLLTMSHSQALCWGSATAANCPLQAREAGQERGDASRQGEATASQNATSAFWLVPAQQDQRLQTRRV